MKRLSKLSETAKQALLENIGAFENYLYTEYNCGRNKQGEEFKSQDEFVSFLLDGFFDDKVWQKELVEDMRHDMQLSEGEFPDLDEDDRELIQFINNL
jgi:hypothetical protein